MKSFFAICLPLASAILNFEFWHQTRKQGSRKTQSTKFHWIKSFVALWFAIWNFQLVVISDFVVLNGVNGRNCLKCPNCSYCSNCSNCPNCSNYSNCLNCSILCCWLTHVFGKRYGSEIFRTVRVRFECWYFEPDTNSSKYLGSVHIPTFYRIRGLVNDINISNIVNVSTLQVKKWHWG